MTETPPVSRKGTSIEALRQRVSKVEGRFLRIDHENTDYRRRLNDLMATLEEDQVQRREEISVLEERIEGVVSENEQLREILDELLTSAETFGEGRLDEPLADLDARVREEAGSTDLIGEAAARIGEARAAAADQVDSGEAKAEAKDVAGVSEEEAAPAEAVSEPEEVGGLDEVEETVDAALDLKPVKETEPGVARVADDEPEPMAEALELVEPDEILVGADAAAVDAELGLEAGPDAVELAANEASEEDVLELEAQVVDVDVEIISLTEVEAEEVAETAPAPEPEAPVQKKPEEAVSAGEKEPAAEKPKAAEITTDKETDQLDRILASIRRITSAL